MFRFTIRELLILTVTAGLAVGWWLDHRRTESVRASRDGWKFQLESVVADLQREGVLITIENEVVLIGGYSGPGGSSERFYVDKARKWPLNLPPSLDEP